MNDLPEVSIGLPVYNGERFLARALDALLAQQHRRFEIVLADNASTDATLAIAAAYAAKDGRIHLLRSPDNLGVEANFARVLRESRGRYFMWAACDDWWAPDYVHRLAAALERAPSAVVAMSAVERRRESGEVTDLVRFSGRDDPSTLSPWQLVMRLAGNRPYHLFIYGLYRAEFLKRAFTGFAPVIGADRLFMCRVAMSGGFAYVDEVLHQRLVRDTPIAERYGDEPIGRLWRGAWPRLRLALLAGPYLWQSPVVPPYRRIWIPAVVARLLRGAIGHWFVQAGWLRPRAPTASSW